MTLSQVPLSFDPRSPMNQILLDQVQRSGMVAYVFSEWLESIAQQGTS